MEFLNENGQPAELLRDVCSVRIKKNGQMITRNQYLSEEYYYGDYTKMNTWLCERYHLPEYLNPPCDPGIKEIEYSRLSGILDSLKEYRKVPVNAVRGCNGIRCGKTDAVSGRSSIRNSACYQQRISQMIYISYSTVTDLARFLGLSTSRPFATLT